MKIYFDVVIKPKNVLYSVYYFMIVYYILKRGIFFFLFSIFLLLQVSHLKLYNYFILLFTLSVSQIAVILITIIECQSLRD